MEKLTGKPLDPFSFSLDSVCFILPTSACDLLYPTVLDRNNPAKYSNSLLQNITDNYSREICKLLINDKQNTVKHNTQTNLYICNLQNACNTEEHGLGDQH
jgi:hypothetical protein